MRKRRTFIAESNTNVSVFTDDDFMSNMDAFVRKLQAENKSKYTVTYYRRELNKFMRTLESQGVTTRLRRLTAGIITDYYINYSLNVKCVSYATVSAGLRALRTFLNWAASSGIIDKSPMGNIKIAAPKTADIETFSREQLRELFRQPDLETFVGFRDYAIMVLLLETGIRLRELVDLKTSDVRWADSQIAVAGKNGHARLVPYQPKTRRVLKQYINARGESYVDHLFITHDDGQMSRKAVQDRIAKYGRMANIKGVRCSPHTFRHTFAKMSVRNGADIFSLQKILGHSSLDMVRVYVNLFSGEVAEAHRKFSPIENLF